MKRKLIIADDYPEIREVISSILNPTGEEFEITEAGDGLAALHLIEMLKPDVAILDIMMPEISGIDVLSKLHENNSPTPIIVLTAKTDEETYTSIKTVNPKAIILTKPLNRQELIDAVNSLLNPASNSITSTSSPR